MNRPTPLEQAHKLAVLASPQRRIRIIRKEDIAKRRVFSDYLRDLGWLDTTYGVTIAERAQGHTAYYIPERSK